MIRKPTEKDFRLGHRKHVETECIKLTADRLMILLHYYAGDKGDVGEIDQQTGEILLSEEGEKDLLILEEWGLLHYHSASHPRFWISEKGKFYIDYILEIGTPTQQWVIPGGNN